MPAVHPPREFSRMSSMKRSGLSLAFCVATLFVATRLQAADEKPGAKTEPARAPAMKTSRMDELLKRFDKNGDGKLDPAERAALESFVREQRDRAAAQVRDEILRRFDRNQDGKIDETEMAEVDPAIRPRVAGNPMQLLRYDKNGDGK